MKYTNQVYYLHKRLARHVPIDSFINALQPSELGLTDKSQFYAPVCFSVQICGGISAPAGAIRVNVPVYANDNWLVDMKKRFAGMIGLKNSLDHNNISFRTTAGQDIATVDKQKLPNIGKLNVFVGDTKVRLAAMPAIPIEYSVCKEANIANWLKQVSEDLPEIIAEELVGHKSSIEIDSAIRGDGPVLKKIQQHLASSMPDNMSWSEFVRTHHMNSPDRVSKEEAQATLVSVSKDMLSNLRSFIAAGAEQIGRYVKIQEAKRIASDLSSRSKEDAKHYEPLLSAAAGGGGDAKAVDGFEMYRKIAEDALASPFVQQAIIATLYNRPIERGCRWKQDPKLRLVPKEKPEAKEASAVAPVKEKTTKKKTKKTAPAVDVPEFVPVVTPGPSADKDSEDDSAEAAATTPAVSGGTVDLSKLDEQSRAFIKAIQEGTADNYETIVDQFIAKGFVAGGEGKGIGRLNALTKIFMKGSTELDKKSGAGVRKNRLLDIANNIPVILKAQIGAHHPWNAQIHHTLQPMADGVYPTYYNLLHTKQDMTKNAPYAGDLGETYKAYHMFSGVAISPPGLLVDPIGRRSSSSLSSGGGRAGRGGKEKKKASYWSSSGDEKEEDMRGYRRMKGQAPPVIPLGRYAAVECGSCGGHSSEDDDDGDSGEGKKLAELIYGTLPPLERVKCGMSSDDDDEGNAKMGSSIALGPRPALIRVADVKAKMRQRLVPVASNEDAEDNAFSNLPSCSDVFGDLDD
ncbi:MAG: hypothetical protein K2Q45_05355 [Nitrosomonas sp.]|nr:hypothetical protein [Nitrosomonas sp.]